MGYYEGITPVHIAAIWGRLDNLKLLIGCGGDPGLRDVLILIMNEVGAEFGEWDELNRSNDKIIVTADQMVAEYGPIPDNKTWTASCRKSEKVRDWCEKTSLTMNKLYPTILTETFTIDTESEPWKSINIARNITTDLTSNETQSNLNDTFKTCLSKKSPPIEISGVEHLQCTSDDDKRDNSNKSNSESNKQRISSFENFSLPGSPHLTHRNYNSKTTLNKKQVENANRSFLFHSSLLTEDSIFDKAIIVAQNKTNEWLYTNKHKESNDACNTRRSSASSGVSSNFSSGSIVVANIEEEYKYEDKEEDVVLIEKRLLVSPVV